MKGHEWIADGWAKLAKSLKAVDPKVRLTNGLTALSTFREFTDILIERGGAGPDSFDGGTTGADEDDMMDMIDYYNDHNMFFCIGIRNKLLEEGPVSAIDEAYKKLCEHTKSQPKFSPGVITAAAHWAPFEHVDAALAAVRKYGKY